MSNKKDGKKGGKGSKPKKAMFAVVAVGVLLASGYFALDTFRPGALEALGQGRVADAFHLAVDGSASR